MSREISSVVTWKFSYLLVVEFGRVNRGAL